MRTFILISLAAHLTLPMNTAPDDVNRLDECIQKRFLDRKAFGMQRILPLQYHGVRQFQPENPSEQAVVNQLKRDGYRVALFLASRFNVQGPAYITPFQNPKELPLPGELFQDSGRAFKTFEAAEGYDVQRGEWAVTLRPLRASNEGCVQCHRLRGANVKLGDPLGVVIYVYKR